MQWGWVGLGVGGGWCLLEQLLNGIWFNQLIGDRFVDLPGRFVGC